MQCHCLRGLRVWARPDFRYEHSPQIAPWKLQIAWLKFPPFPSPIRNELDESIGPHLHIARFSPRCDNKLEVQSSKTCSNSTRHRIPHNEPAGTQISTRRWSTKQDVTDYCRVPSHPTLAAQLP